MFDKCMLSYFRNIIGLIYNKNIINSSIRTFRHDQPIYLYQRMAMLHQYAKCNSLSQVPAREPAQPNKKHFLQSAQEELHLEGERQPSF